MEMLGVKKKGIRIFSQSFVLLFKPKGHVCWHTWLSFSISFQTHVSSPTENLFFHQILLFTREYSSSYYREYFIVSLEVMVIKNFGLTFEQKNVLDIVRFQLMNSTYLNNYFHFFKNNLLIWPNFHHFPFNYSLIVSLRHKIFATGKCQDPIVRNLIIEKATQK